MDFHVVYAQKKKVPTVKPKSPPQGFQRHTTNNKEKKPIVDTLPPIHPVSG